MLVLSRCRAAARRDALAGERLVLETVDEVRVHAPSLAGFALELGRLRSSMTLIATKGTPDMAYPPFILASTASALGWEVSIFFNFHGLNLLKNDLDLKVTPMGNPAMPLKLPFGPDWLKSQNLHIPALLMSIPGLQAAATGLMKKTMRSKGVADIVCGRRAVASHSSPGQCHAGAVSVV